MTTAQEISPTCPVVGGLQQPALRQEHPLLGSIIVLDALPTDRGVELAIERLLRMVTGETVEVHAQNASALRRVLHWMRAFDAATYSFDCTHTDPDWWQLHVTRRSFSR